MSICFPLPKLHCHCLLSCSLFMGLCLFKSMSSLYFSRFSEGMWLCVFGQPTINPKGTFSLNDVRVSLCMYVCPRFLLQREAKKIWKLLITPCQQNSNNISSLLWKSTNVYHTSGWVMKAYRDNFPKYRSNCVFGYAFYFCLELPGLFILGHKLSILMSRMSEHWKMQ